MTWAEIESFIRARTRRGFMDACKGVAIEDVGGKTRAPVQRIDEDLRRALPGATRHSRSR